jgi:HAE1 family hydrophobic/amphiphilic exporter-1
MSKFFINRPIVAMVISILMTIIGLVAMSLPTAQFPNIVPPEIKVTATYTGADALTLEQPWPRRSNSRCPAWTT